MQLTTVRYLYTSIRMANTQNIGDTKYGWEC